MNPKHNSADLLAAVGLGPPNDDALMQQIEQLAEATDDDLALARALVPLIVPLGRASGAYVWLDKENQHWTTVAGDRHANLAHADEWLNSESHQAWIQKALQTGQPQFVPNATDPQSDKSAEFRGFEVFLIPILAEPLQGKPVVGMIVELLYPANTNQDHRNQGIRLALRAGAVLQQRAVRLRFRGLRDQQNTLSSLSEFELVAHGSLNEKLTAFVIANEVRRFLGVDRVTVLLKRWGAISTSAVSQQDVVDRRSQLIRRLESVTREIVKTNEPTWFQGDVGTVSPQIREPLVKYLDESFTKNIAVIPLFRYQIDKVRDVEHDRRLPLSDSPVKKKLFGAIVIEQIEGEFQLPAQREKWNSIRPIVETSLANAMEHSRIPFIPVWRLLKQFGSLFTGRRRHLATAITAAIVLLFILALVVPAELRLTGKGELQPKLRRDVFAQADGVVEKLLIETGAKVIEGQVLAQLVNHELESQIAQTAGSIRELEEKIVSNQKLRLQPGKTQTPEEAARLAQEAQTLKTDLSTAKNELAILNGRRSRLEIRSPMTGTVITWNLQQRLLNRPVQPGQVLFTVARPEGEWELEIYMPEKRMQHIDLAVAAADGEPLDVSYILEALPEQKRVGKLRSIQPATNVHQEHGANVRLRIDVPLTDAEKETVTALPGSSVVSHVHCGQRSFAYCKLHEGWEWWQRFVFTWW